MTFWSDVAMSLAPPCLPCGLAAAFRHASAEYSARPPHRPCPPEDVTWIAPAIPQKKEKLSRALFGDARRLCGRRECGICLADGPAGCFWICTDYVLESGAMPANSPDSAVFHAAPAIDCFHNGNTIRRGRPQTRRPGSATSLPQLCRDRPRFVDDFEPIPPIRLHWRRHPPFLRESPSVATDRIRKALRPGFVLQQIVAGSAQCPSRRGFRPCGERSLPIGARTPVTRLACQPHGH